MRMGVGASKRHPVQGVSEQTVKNIPMPQAQNLLIQQLPPAVRKRLQEQCEPFELVLSAELSKRGQPLSHAYFPHSGFISLVIDVDTYPALEVGMVGRESMLGSEPVSYTHLTLPTSDLV